MSPLHHNAHEEHLIAHQRRLRCRRRCAVILGLCLMLVGYILLAVSPDTPNEWVLIRVATGFGLLITGFGIAIMPMLSRVSGGDD